MSYWGFYCCGRHHDHSNSYKQRRLIGLAYSLVVQSIDVMVGQNSMQANVVLQKELRVLNLDTQAIASERFATLRMV